MVNEEEKSFEELYEQSLKDEKRLEKVITGKIIGVSHKGELFVNFGYKADGIIPKAEYEGIDDSEFKIGDMITCSVLKQNDGEGNVLLSYRKYKIGERKRNKYLEKAEREEKQKAFWEKVEVGQKYEGTVSALSSYGAFVDIGGVQGLLHISEISWNRNAKPEEILSQGQKIEVTIIEADKENHRLKFGYGDKGPNPWESVDKEYEVGKTVKARVIKLMPFGVFVELKPGIEGLIHISQLSNKRINKPEDVVKVDEEIEAKIIALDKENQRIELSMKVLIPAETVENNEENKPEEDNKEEDKKEETENKEVEENKKVEESSNEE